MGKWRGYVVANKGGHGRVAMRDSGKTFDTRQSAIANMQSDNSKWMKKNYSPQWAKAANFEYGAVQDGQFKDGSKGYKKLLEWHDAGKSASQASHGLLRDPFKTVRLGY